MAEATPFNAALGNAVRQRRKSLELPQDALARRVWPFGWTRNVVAAIERGTRDLTVPESLALAAALQTDLASLLAGLGDVEVAPDTAVAGSDLSKQLTDPSPWRIRHALGEAQWNFALGIPVGWWGDAGYRMLGYFSDVDVSAAERLNVEPEVVSLAAEALWGHSLTDERDARVAATEPADATARSRQAVRGHVTRALLADLQAHLNQETKPK